MILFNGVVEEVVALMVVPLAGLPRLDDSGDLIFHDAGDECVALGAAGIVLRQAPAFETPTTTSVPKPFRDLDLDRAL